ncbi:phosphatase PAP2 family protein [Thomasclavelia spiroformis]|uniref:phosphatase PAP2 family protein n=1 Tax=Thomasclavelia spiroformis TaxID=29348 RepID=UPI00241D6C7B|nr:phosphatase PAP2 family protein [Thomasclavelia spiroformis]MBS6114182.1 phosphatase PAP2 family protein [Thomasclavelia spiroformis]
MVLELIKNYKKWLFLIPLGLFILDYILIETGLVAVIDLYVYQFLHYFKSPFMTNMFTTITHLGGFIGITAVIILIFLFNRRFALSCLSLSVLQQILNNVLKIIFKRPRPSVEHLVEVSNYSFPSGHAMAITCLYALIICYIYRSKPNYRNVLIILCVLVIILVNLSRVYLGVHYFSDVFAGSMLSLSLVLYVSNKTFFIC